MEDNDILIRSAAFDTLRRITDVRGDVTSQDLAAGFQYQGERIPFVNPRRGIFKPKQMRYLLSIKTVFPRSHARVWYEDQRDVHRQVYEGEESVDYAFMGTDPDAADNRWLIKAFEIQVPIVYFLGVAPGCYQAIFPSYIAGWDSSALKARVAFGVPGQVALGMPSTPHERRYAMREVKQRLHQSSFREAVVSAYGSRCALSGLPEPSLLDAAHIVSDRDEALGQPIVPNGIPLSKIHHAAFDAHLIGIDTNFQIHVSPRLLIQNDGPMLEALKRLHGEALHLPARMRDRPDRDRLALRFAEFQEHAERR